MQPQNKAMDSFTHIAKIYGVRCYFNENTGDIEGTNWLNQKLIEMFIWIDLNLTDNEMFKIQILEKL